MIKPAYVITLSVQGAQGNAETSQIWDSEKPLEIGHPFRWVAEKTEHGVRIRNVAADSSAAVRELTEVALQKGASIELPEAEKTKSSGFTLAIRPVISLPPAIKTHGKEAGEIRVYALRGDWSIDSARLEERYVGYTEGSRAFEIRRAAGGYRVKSFQEHVRFGEASLPKGEHIQVTDHELTGTALSIGEFKWRFAAQKRVGDNAVPTLVAKTDDIEQLAFRKSLKLAGGMLAVFALLALVWPKPNTETVIAPQFTKMIFKKPVHAYATAAAMGHANDISYGSKPRPKARGSSLKKTEVAHVVHKAPGHPHHQKSSTHLAKAAPSHSHSRSAPKPVAKAVAKAPTQHSPRTAPPKAVAKAPTHAPKIVASAPKAITHSPKVSTQAALTSKIVARGPIHVAVKPTHEERDTQLAKTLADPSFMQASHGLAKGGMSQLIADKGYANGQDSKAEARGMFKSGKSHGGSFGSSDSLPSHGVDVASIGGDSGLLSGNGGVGYGRGSHAQVSGQGKSFVSVDPGKSDVDEGLTKEQVGAVIHAHMSEIRYCYESAQLRNPDLAGKLSVAFVVGAPGTVNSARLAQAGSAERALGDCLVGRLRGWQFPHPRGGVNVAVNYPFIFKTLGR